MISIPVLITICLLSRGRVILKFDPVPTLPTWRSSFQPPSSAKCSLKVLIRYYFLATGSSASTEPQIAFETLSEVNESDVSSVSSVSDRDTLVQSESEVSSAPELVTLDHMEFAILKKTDPAILRVARQFCSDVQVAGEEVLPWQIF